MEGTNEAANIQADGLLLRTYDLGVKCMQCKDYKKALSLFSKAMKLSRSYSMDLIERLRVEAGLPRRSAHDESKAYHPLYNKLLDSRISCLMKVGDYKRAVRESEYFCKIEPCSTRAMLRLGKSYELANNWDKARATYKKGQELVDRLRSQGTAVSPLHEKLFNDRYLILLRSKSMENADPSVRQEKRVLIEQKTVGLDVELDEDFSVSKKVKTITKDPIDTLPVELVISIMTHLDTKDITTCMRVSKLWYNKLSNTPMIIDAISLNKTSCSKVNSMVKFIKSKNCVSSTIASLNYSVMVSSEELKCSQLLFHNLAKYVEKMVLQFSHTDIAKILRLLVGKRVLTEQLKEFSIFGSYDPLSLRDNDGEFLQNVPALQKLEVLVGANTAKGGTTSMNGIQQRQLSYDITPLSHSLQSIKLLYKDNRFTEPPPFACILRPAIHTFPKVQKLVIANLNFGSIQSRDWVKNFPNVTELWLERNTGASLMDFIGLLKNGKVFKQLTHLTYRESPSESTRSYNVELYSDHEMDTVIENLHKLRTLDLMNSSIGRSVLYRLLNELPHIKTLNIGNLTEISDELYPRTDTETTVFLFLRHMQNLKVLSVPNMSFHHTRCFRQLALVLPEIESLNRLDLSFNPSMQGYQLYDIARELNNSQVKLQCLIVDGCQQISPNTVKDIEQRGYVESVQCSFNKPQWEKFGVNSFWYR